MTRRRYEFDEVHEYQDGEEEIPHVWQPSSDTLRVLRVEHKDVSEDLPTIKGFEDSDILDNEEVAEYIASELPPEHVNAGRIKEIRYTNRYVGDEREYTAGTCTTDPKSRTSNIEINKQSPEGDDDPEEMKRCIAHEVGHNVYHNLSDAQKAMWNELYATSFPHEFVSDYAQTNEREDFAETYATYVHDPEYLKVVSPAKYAFMYRHVFKGREYT